VQEERHAADLAAPGVRKSGSLAEPRTLLSSRMDVRDILLLLGVLQERICPSGEFQAFYFGPVRGVTRDAVSGRTLMHLPAAVLVMDTPPLRRPFLHPGWRSTPTASFSAPTSGDPCRRLAFGRVPGGIRRPPHLSSHRRTAQSMWWP
jgi:hypothetical protein